MFGRVAFGYLLEAFPAPCVVEPGSADLVAETYGRIMAESSSHMGEHQVTFFELTCSGGQCVRVTDPKGRPVVSLQADQSPSDARVDTLLQAAKHRTPIVLIAGAGYDNLPWDLGCAYAVLGW
jgi:hypothetical protein